MRDNANGRVFTSCGICSCTCGLWLRIENGTITEVEGQEDHPINRGFICPKGRAIPELEHAHDRLQQPLIRNAAGVLKSASWDAALDFAAERLERVKAEYGPEAVAIHVGEAGIDQQFLGWARRFAQAFGTPNYSHAGAHCHLSKQLANTLTYGKLPIPDYPNSSCIVLWGTNPLRSYPPRGQDVLAAWRRGARLIVVDPAKTSIARQADIHLQLRPGTDVALALGLIHLILTEHSYDRGFVKRWTVGLDQLAERTSAYRAARVEKITGVPAELLVRAARLYAGSRPACIGQGISLELQMQGLQAARAVAILQALTGNLDVSGGALFPQGPRLARVTLGKMPPHTRLAIGAERFPLFCDFAGIAQSNLYHRAILEDDPYPLRALVVQASNPVVSWPQSSLVREALSRLDFLAVMDVFPTPTTELADLVLPAATFLERPDLWSADHVTGEQCLGLSPQVLDAGERLSDWSFWTKLASKLGLGESFPWADEEQALDYRLAPLGLSTAGLRGERLGISYGDPATRKYQDKGFNTPSGKVELVSSRLQEQGYDGFPDWEPFASDQLGDPELFPLIFTSGARSIGYVHSRFRNLPSLRRLNPRPRAEVNPQTASSLDLSDGDQAELTSPKGSVCMTVRLTDDVAAGVVRMPHGWAEADANLLTDSLHLDPITGFPAARAFRGQLHKAGKATPQ